MWCFTVLFTIAVMLGCCGCGTHTWSLHYDSTNPRVYVTSSGGLQQLLPGGGPRYLPNHTFLDAPAEGGDVYILYETVTHPGTYTSVVEWQKNDEFIAQTGVNQAVHFSNSGAGTQRVRAIVYQRYAGNRRGDGQDTLQFSMVTYWKTAVGLQRLQHGTFTPVYSGEALLVPNSHDLCLTYRPSRTEVDSRYLSRIRWSIDGQLFRETGANVSVSCPIPVDGTHIVTCELVWCQTDAPLSSAGIEMLQLTVERWVDQY